MKSLRQVFVGLLTAIGSALLVLMAASLALAEGGRMTELPAVNNTPTITVSPLPGTLPVILTATPTLEPTRCQPPSGWSQYTVQAGDTLESLAAQAGLTVENLTTANCLRSPSLPVGSIVYLPVVNTTPTETVPPPLPTIPTTTSVMASETPLSCGRPYGWTIHVVQSGETLFRLSQAYGVSTYQLQQANCLNGTTIIAGQSLYVPNVITNTPVYTRTAPATRTHTPQPSETPGPTNTPETPTNTPITPSATPLTITPEATTITPQVTVTTETPGITPGTGGMTGSTTPQVQQIVITPSADSTTGTTPATQ